MLVWEESGGPEEYGAEGVRKAGEKPGGGLMQQCLIFCNHEKDLIKERTPE